MKNTALRLTLLAFSMLLTQSLFVAAAPANAQDRDYQKREAAVKENMKFARRLKNIAAPVRIKLAKACGNMTTPFIGAEFATTDSVGENFQQVMKNLYNTGLYPTITMVAAQSPAANTLKLGDMITHVNGVKLTQGRDSLGEIIGYIRSSKNNPLKLTLDRKGSAKTITVKPVPACDKPARLVNKKSSDVFVDDMKIGVTKGILKSVSNDEKIANEIEEELIKSLEG